MNIYDAETLKKLECANCLLLLSVGPVTINKYNGFMCGRCFDDEAPVITIYEVLAQQFTFPCRYQPDGCKAKLKWGSVKEHEETCPRKPHKCPATTSCAWRGAASDMANHFKETHHEDYISETNAFEILLAGNEMFCKVINTKRKNYILNLNIKNGKKLLLNVNQLIDLNQFKNHQYELKLYSIEVKKHLVLGPFDVVPYSSITSNDTENNVVDIPSVLKFLNPSSPIFCEIIVDKEIVDNKELLKLLECPVCKDFMGASIYQCQTGHSFCSPCMNNMHQRCPLCSSHFSNTRNYVLEDLASKIATCCKNKERGCTYKCWIEDLEQHEENCHFNWSLNELQTWNPIHANMDRRRRRRSVSR